MQNFRSIGWQGRENDYIQGHAKFQIFENVGFFVSEAVWCHISGGFWALAALRGNSKTISFNVARRDGSSESNSIGRQQVIGPSTWSETIPTFWSVFRSWLRIPKFKWNEEPKSWR